jgi:hypothetical protein
LRSAKKRSLELLPDDILDDVATEDLSDNLPLELIPVFLGDEPSDTAAFRRNKKVLSLHFLDGHSWEEIGRRMGITRAGARFLGMRAIREIRNKFAHVIQEY